MKLNRFYLVSYFPLASANIPILAADTTTDRLFSLVDPVSANTTEFKLNLGITPLSLYGDLQTSDPWATPMSDGCPKLCSLAGADPSSWTHVHHQSDLIRCQKPLLFDFHLQSDSIETFRACTVPDKIQSVRRSLKRTRKCHHKERGHMAKIAAENTNFTSPSCGASQSSMVTVLSVGPSGVLDSPADAVAALDSLSEHLKSTTPCGQTLLFAKYHSAIVGLYTSADIQTSTSDTSVLDSLKSHVMGGSEIIQSCDTNSHNPYKLGLFAIDSFKSLPRAQRVFRHWVGGECVSMKRAGTRKTFEINVLGLEGLVPSNDTGVSSAPRDLQQRADCKAIQVVSGDSCGSLSATCGINGNNFLKYNTKDNLCATLMPKQWVCCSSGSLPDKTPKPQSDGTCATHTIAADDGCWAIADNYGIKVSDIEKYNNKTTWGWAGCDRLQIGQVICLSKGNTPMPTTVEGVACGPQKPGTKKPSGDFDGWDLAKLNQCPLNACCSGYGFCGTTKEFCTESPADTGAPGAFKAGTNGCISNCGTDIVNNDDPPASFMKLAYFQGYNIGRYCLRMDATEIPEASDDLTHVHFSFAGLSSDLGITIDDNVKDQLEKFESMDAPFKKVISLGGWAESTGNETFQRYRDAVKPENRERVADNIMNYLNDHKSFAGIDIDWEYPGATDQGIPAGDMDDGLHYLDFLKVLRKKLGSDKSISVALPASYWYLKPFPVDGMADVVDYFIYLTYDLHGQWDYGNKYANPGCENGNCLRSHVNRTETENALSMLTKAGVPASKIVVGVASYGRSFRMADKKCTGPACLFTGSYSESDAEPGLCTATGGYISNAELDEIYSYAESGEEGYSAKQWYDKATDSDMMTYGTLGDGMTDWVAYMSDETKQRRTDWVKGLNFAGTTDWAIDLADWHDGPSDIEGGWGVEAENFECDSESWPTTLEDLESSIDSVPPQCRGMALMRVLFEDLVTSVDEYKEVSKDYDDKFWWYADWLKDSIDDRLEEFMAIKRGTGLKFMDCKWESPSNSGEGPCTEASPVTKPGPDPGARIVEFTMRDENGFYDALLSETGIKKNWIRWAEKDALLDPCTPCPGGLPTCPGQASCGSNYYLRKNFPKRIDDKSKIDVDNPKELVDMAIPSTEDLIAVMVGTYATMRTDVEEADEDDIVTSFSLPIFMLQDASESIKMIKKIGEEQKEAHTRDLVLGILSIVFAIIPFVGEAAVALGGAAKIASVALIIGEGGNAALSIVDIVNNPESAPFAILGLLVGAAGLRAGKPPKEVFKNAADARRALSGSALKSFSEEFQRKDRLVQNIVKTCKV
ncbi:hypothetical protein F5Y08DRAFT_347581 [Xylaria arbuscula]|nr:hypothetical protein F5Y08DRAFT_347581 [Xylaria arbuscula]